VLRVSRRKLLILLPFVLTATAAASPTINSCTVTWCNRAETVSPNAIAFANISNLPESLNLYGTSGTNGFFSSLDSAQETPSASSELMAVAGYLYVSLIKGCETRLVLAVFVIWLGVAGIAKLPLLVSCAIITIDSSLCLLTRLTSAVRRFVCFSPAFILDCAARGPPHLLQENL